jgi:hypothetical protein
MAHATSPPLLLPRGLIFVAFAWLVGSWLVAVGVRPPVQPSAESYEPGVRMLLVCVALGLMVAWPLTRLSQPASAYPLRQTMLDLLVLLAMAQVVIWPLRLVTTWTRERTAAMDATLIAWTLLAGAVVACAIGTRSAGVRCLAMSACLAMCLGAPVVAWIGLAVGVDAIELADLSPLLSMNALGKGRGSDVSTGEWLLIGVLGGAAAGAWIAATAVCRAARGIPGGEAAASTVS